MQTRIYPTIMCHIAIIIKVVPLAICYFQPFFIRLFAIRLRISPVIIFIFMPSVYFVMTIMIKVVCRPVIFIICLIPTIVHHITIIVKIVPFATWCYYPFFIRLFTIRFRISPIAIIILVPSIYFILTIIIKVVC